MIVGAALGASYVVDAYRLLTSLATVVLTLEVSVEIMWYA